MSSPQSSECSPSSSPLAANAPKFGTPVPNRIFVGGIAPNTTEAELHSLFSNYGNVKATKIISDRAGVSKGYGFVTFETEDEAKRIQKEADNISLKDRKLNIAPAIKKQPFARIYGEISPLSEAGPGTPNGTILYHNGVPYTYHNGMAFFTNTSDGLYQYHGPQAASYPLVYPQAYYVPHQAYAYQAPTSPAAAIPTHYLYATPLATSALSPSTSSSPSPNSSPTPGTSSCTSSATTSLADANCEGIGGSSVTCVSPLGGPGEFYTLYNGGSLASIPHGSLATISMVPSFGLALAGPLSSERPTGPLTPTSPDQDNDGESGRNLEAMTRSPYSVSGSTVVYGSYDSQLYSATPSHPYNTSYKNESVGSGYSHNDHGNSSQSYSHYERNQSYNSGGGYKASGNNSYGGGPGSNKHQSGSSKRNSGVNCSLSSGKSPLKNYNSPVRSYNNSYRNNHPSTPKSSNSSGYSRHQNTGTGANHNGGGYFGNNGNDVVSSRTFKHLHGQQPHLVAKSVNGVTVMAYPAPMMVTATPLSQSNMATTMMNVSAKDHKLVQGDHFPNAEAMIRGHSSMPSPMTPPHTPLALTVSDNSSNQGKKNAEPILAIKKLKL